MSEPPAEAEPLGVWIDQELCTGDGLCVQYAPEVFEFDIDGLAYVKDSEGRLLEAVGARADVPARLRLDVIDSAKECPGDVHPRRAAPTESRWRGLRLARAELARAELAARLS